MSYLQGKARILLVCNNAYRDLPALKLLKRELGKTTGAKVVIVGSVAEVQRTYYLLFKFKPHMVFLYQVQEQAHRDLAKYIKDSGGIVCVVPTEVTVAGLFGSIVVNVHMVYDKLLDYYFFPSKDLYQYFLEHSDIKKNKLYITGSPKFDINFQKPQNMNLARTRFFLKNKLPQEHKNIFILTSFYSVPAAYINKDIGYSGDRKNSLRFFHFLAITKQQYLSDIKKLCDDFPDCNIVVKPHPLEEVGDYEDISKPNCFVVKKKTIQECIPAIDLAIHWNSTAAMECWPWSKKTIQYNPIGKSDNYLSNFVSGNPLCHSYPLLRSAIEKYLSGKLEPNYLKNQRRLLEETFGKLDGRSSQRIAEIIKKKLSRGLPEVHFKRRYSPLWLIVFLTEKIIGQRLTGEVIKLLRNDYQAEYALQNRITD